MKMAGETILIVDDSAEIREIITMYLENEGYNVITAMDGSQALDIAFSLNPDLIILDMMLPDLDGIEVCQELRKNLSTPIIFLSCKSTPNDKSFGLIAGGDDYMSKPFEAIELLARIKAQLRRTRMIQKKHQIPTTKKLLSYASLTVDLGSHSITLNEEEVVLSPKEFQLLALLAQNPNKVFGNEDLYQALWRTPSLGDYRTITVHISNIRKKIEPDPKKPMYIKTIKGVGYKFISQD